MGRITGVTPEETRSRLVQAAIQVFAERGYEGTRIANIAERAGLSSGAIYAHFTSKAELLVEAIRAHSPAELSRLLLPADLRGHLPELLVELGTSLERRDPTQRSLLIDAIATARRDPELAVVLAASVRAKEDLIAGLVSQSQAEGELAADLAPDAVARVILMLVLGALLARALNLPPTDPDDWSRFIGRLVDSFRAEGNP